MPDVAEAGDPQLWLYLLPTAAVGLLCALLVARRLRRVKSRREAQLDERPTLEAVASDGPVDDATASMRSHSQRSIERYFKASRRVLVPSIILFTALGMAIPFIDEVPAAFLSLFVGALTVVIGIAARTMLENMLAGLVLTFTRSINIGDTVMLDEHYGTIEEISMTHTTIKIWDWRRYVVPNSRMLDVELINYTLNDGYQWAQIGFWVGYDTDMALLERIAVEAPRGSASFADHEPPRFWVMEMAPHGVRCLLAAWADGPAEAWELKCDTRTALLRGFAEHGIRCHTWTVDAALDGPVVGGPAPR